MIMSSLCHVMYESSLVHQPQSVPVPGRVAGGWWLPVDTFSPSVCLFRSLSCSLINRPSSLVSVLFKASPALKGELKYPLLLPGPFSLSPVISS